MLIVSIITTVVLCVFAISISTQASGLERTAQYKYYKSIEVSKGDTLWSIAAENFDTEHYKNIQEYVKEIKEMNAMKSDHIMSGSCLIIPYYAPDDLVHLAY
jgi:LysM repeat protein